MGRVRLGIDTGGTFTDFMLIDEHGAIRVGKLLSDSDRPSQCIGDGIEELLQQGGPQAADIVQFVYGTTVATNALLEGTTAKAGLVTTDGFRDVLEIGRHTRRDLYNIFYQKRRQLVPRHLRREVGERIDPRGDVLRPMDEGQLAEVLDVLAGEGVESLAICFINAYANADHERRAKQLVLARYPQLHVSTSHEISAEYREYERMSTTTVNAVIAPVVARHLAEVEQVMRRVGMQCSLHIMESNGGVTSAHDAKARSVTVIESGPAAGVIAAAHIAASMRLDNVISLDMGGTTAKAGLVENGDVKMVTEYEVGAGVHGGHEGYPIKIPVLDLVEVGAGGGSIAWIDEGGALRVGPKSAGSVPGPVCYGRGGEQPTSTDANLMLGRINPRNFLGGRIALDARAAARTLETTIARPLRLGLLEAADGILEVENASMLRAIRLVTVERGHDPRDFALVAFGGAGPLHAGRLAEELGIRTVVIPIDPGLLSALGLLLADVRHDFVQAYVRPVASLDGNTVATIFGRLQDQARRLLVDEGFSSDQIQLKMYADLRYRHQAYELTLPVTPMGPADGRMWELVETDFHRTHKKLYGHSAPGAPTEIVNLRVSAIGVVPKPDLRPLTPSGHGAAGRSITRARLGVREIYFASAGRHLDCLTYDRARLLPEDVIRGPAIVEEPDSTVVVFPGHEGLVDEFGNIIISVGA